jgi:23S rRNA (uracil1939-C5)-methyltransferase
MTDHHSEKPSDSGVADAERTLRIDRIVSGGDGLARREDGCVVFVPRTAPGDLVEVEYTEQHKRWRRARPVRIVEPGPDRRDPPCPHYERCGGCQLQHLEYRAQLDARASIVIDCLRRLGDVTLTELHVEPSPREFGYRNRISLVARRTGDRISAGYHALDNPDEVVDILACPLAEDSINSVWASLRDALPDLLSARESGAALRLTLRASADGRVALAIEGVKDADEVSRQIELLTGLDAVWWLDSKGEVTAKAGTGEFSERWDEYEIPLTGTAFLQVNRETAALLDAHVRAQCGSATERRIVDAYCGFGLRAVELARDGATVSAIDVDRHSITAGSQLAAQAGVAVQFTTAPVERALPSQLPADIVILNPPRRGVDRHVLTALTKQPPERIIYVSCNPATLARDIKGLGATFQMSECRAFDLFPQTAHVETVATLTRV